MTDSRLLKWLLDSDVSVQFQVHRDLLRTERNDLRQRIATEGWGARFLELQRSDGHWGRGFYQPKWISTHYTLLDLKHLQLPPETTAVRKAIGNIVRDEKGPDGGINPSGTISQSDVCINGMFLNYASYFKTPEDDLKPVVDFILSQQLPDGGFNCRFNRSGARHSSLHSTISVAEGICEYATNGYRYRLPELQLAALGSREFLLVHRLFRSHRTGQIIDPKMLLLSYPSRWKFDILRALDYFRSAGAPFDERMSDALEILAARRRKDGTWPLQHKHPGQTHFDMERGGQPSRWNTLRALRVFEHFGMADLLKP